MIMPLPIAGAKKHKPTVLVIDDEAGPRDALKVILRPFFNIQSAESARAAIDVLNHQQIDLITLDQKQRLDYLLDFMQPRPRLWGSEAESAQAEADMRTG